jgi:hypothetical protein
MAGRPPSRSVPWLAHELDESNGRALRIAVDIVQREAVAGTDRDPAEVDVEVIVRVRPPSPHRG